MNYDSGRIQKKEWTPGSTALCNILLNLGGGMTMVTDFDKVGRFRKRFCDARKEVIENRLSTTHSA
jgi:hypothetical protein